VGFTGVGGPIVGAPRSNSRNLPRRPRAPRLRRPPLRSWDVRAAGEMEVVQGATGPPRSVKGLLRMGRRVLLELEQTS
jgi:hypothetical protein